MEFKSRNFTLEQLICVIHDDSIPTDEFILTVSLLISVRTCGFRLHVRETEI